jgi:hypothetical protein
MGKNGVSASRQLERSVECINMACAFIDRNNTVISIFTYQLTPKSIGETPK